MCNGEKFCLHALQVALRATPPPPSMPERELQLVLGERCISQNVQGNRVIRLSRKKYKMEGLKEGTT